MHMVVGLILATLMNKKNLSGHALPFIKGKFEPKHVLPGRIRFRVPLIETAEKIHLEAVHDQLSKVPQIQSFDISPFSGSILIRYDQDKIDTAVVYGILIKILGLEQLFDENPESIVQKEIKKIGNIFNQTVYNRTAGTVDFASAMTLLTLGLGLYKILVLKDRTLPGGFNLLWWAYVMAKSRK
jgi:hypothetical protein